MYIDKTKLISADISVWLSSLLRELTKNGDLSSLYSAWVLA
ncbi:hypothetical protein VCNHCC008D_000989 [Vibrio cholerae O1 str. NHCC-008D]|nr:hypothetical protein VCNHCC008D_000989 [Vibrio cholerae O1 str. NHCC-008D]